MAPTDDLLSISREWPEERAEPGQVLMTQGEETRRLLVLLDGSLDVLHAGRVVATIDTPGACVGEISLLLDQGHHSTVVATSTSRVRVLTDAHEALATDPALLLPVASVLASRLRLVTSYLADLQQQYGEDHPGLGMVGNVLGTLTRHSGTALDIGSDREPDAPY